ncbi:MAG: hypothetical protein D6723_08650 [Acidobacteria bacterium]|nr:MAG: hypothetical protein D6723_08650 [Acidobacteriota bacterium]
MIWGRGFLAPGEECDTARHDLVFRLRGRQAVFVVFILIWPGLDGLANPGRAPSGARSISDEAMVHPMMPYL